jgi:hypothetical protein
MTRTIGLRGYPEAVLASSEVKLDLPGMATASAVVEGLAARHPQLSDALLGADGHPRESIKVLIGNAPIGHASPVPADGEVTVLAALPCDG